MDIKSETFADKSEWLRGPWDNEPDKIEWRDEVTKYPCLIVRHERAGHLCGYVGVSPGHPWHGKGYDDVDASVHGGLTFAEGCQEDGKVCHVPAPGEPDNVWWLGFDCAHSGDLSPGHEAFFRPRGFRDRGDIYRDVPTVRAWVTNLAKQAQSAALAQVAATHP